MSEITGIDSNISLLLSQMVKNPQHLSHLLFVGPPGSGKTTTARNLVTAFYGKRKHYTGKALFLNSSDERSLEAIRSKVYPFSQSQLSNLFGIETKKIPKIIIFDEAETLTEQAQTALRPLLDKPANELLIIFLCNSISRIHYSILHRFLRICFETPISLQFKERFTPILQLSNVLINNNSINNITDMISISDIYFRRGDIRFFLYHHTLSSIREFNNFGSTLLHCSLNSITIRSYIEKYTKNVYIRDCITQILFLFQRVGCIDINDIYTMNNFADINILACRPLSDTIEDIVNWIIQLRVKFENSF